MSFSSVVATAERLRVVQIGTLGRVDFSVVQIGTLGRVDFSVVQIGTLGRVDFSVVRELLAALEGFK